MEQILKDKIRASVLKWGPTLLAGHILSVDDEIFSLVERKVTDEREIEDVIKELPWYLLSPIYTHNTPLQPLPVNIQPDSFPNSFPISMRDFFASQYMGGRAQYNHRNPEGLAREAYEFADALIKAGGHGG